MLKCRREKERGGSDMKYVQVEMELIYFENEDVITTSGGDDDSNTWN